MYVRDQRSAAMVYCRRMAQKTVPKVIIIPGNGGATPRDNWFPYLQRELEAAGITVVNRQFPDPELARAKYWLPFIQSLGADEHTILVGHSSGAIAAMRFAETHKILGSILVGAYHTDLGIEAERLSGYFDAPWDWPAIKKHQRWIVIFASVDDPYIAIEEPRFLAQQLDAEYHEYVDEGHFGGDKQKTAFPELVTVIKEMVIKK